MRRLSKQTKIPQGWAVAIIAHLGVFPPTMVEPVKVRVLLHAQTIATAAPAIVEALFAVFLAAEFSVSCLGCNYCSLSKNSVTSLNLEEVVY